MLFTRPKVFVETSTNGREGMPGFISLIETVRNTFAYQKLPHRKKVAKPSLTQIFFSWRFRHLIDALSIQTTVK